jgi:hypothetical protein
MAKAVSNEERMRMKKERSEKRKETLKKIGQGVSKAVSAVKEVVLKNPKIREGVKEAAKQGLTALGNYYGVPKQLIELVGPVVDAADTSMGQRAPDPVKPGFDYKNDPAFKPFVYVKPKPSDQPYRPPSHSRFAVTAN